VGDSAQADAFVGTVIDGRYEVGSLLGSGAMGHVYRGRQLALDREIAVKVLHARHAEDPELIARFKREAKAASAIGHPGIIQVFDFGQLPDGRAYLVMEFVAGESIGEALGREGAFEPRRAVAIAAQICSVLEVAHDRGIVHRDLKPDNVLLMADDRIKLIDFGIAKLLNVSLVLTRQNTTIGTPLYMAPEQWQASEVDGRTDLYALGGMIFEMIAGRPPFAAGELTAIITKHLTETPPSLESLVTGVPAALSELVARCLAKAREDRPESAAVLGAGLVSAIDSQAGCDPISTGTAASPPVESTAPTVAQPASVPLVAETQPESTEHADSVRPVRIAGMRSTFPLIAAGGGALLILSGAAVYGGLQFWADGDTGPEVAPESPTSSLGASASPPADPESPVAPDAPSPGPEPSAPPLNAPDTPSQERTKRARVAGRSVPPRTESPPARPAAPGRQFYVRSIPSEALVSSDGVVLGRTPLRIDGSQYPIVRISYDGFRSRRVQYQPGGSTDPIRLEPIAPIMVSPTRTPSSAPEEPTPAHSPRLGTWDDGD